MISIFFMLFAASCYFSLARDSGVLRYLLLIGFLQDPARKLMAAEPVYMTIAVGLVAACMFARQLLVNRASVTDPYLRWTNSLLAPLTLYLVVLSVQAVHALVRYGSPMVPALGSIFYLAPLVAISVGYAQSTEMDRVKEFLTVHIWLAIVVAVSVVVSFYGVESDLLGEVGSGLTIYDQGTILKAHSGLMRSSEIAGWHMGAAACFLLIMLVEKNSLKGIVLTASLVIVIFTAIVLTGRRKMIFQVLMFAALYFPFLQLYQNRVASGYFTTAILLAGFAYIAAVMFFPLLSNPDFELYLMRGSTVFGDATERFSSLGLGSVGWAIDQFGLFGGGLGIAAQGVHHFGGLIARGVAEGGLGKIVSELGVISLVVIAWLVYVIAVHIHRCLRLVARTMPARLPFVVGVAVFIASNIPTFIVASQVFGDVFVLLIIGLLLGFLFAMPRLMAHNINLGNLPK